MRLVLEMIQGDFRWLKVKQTQSKQASKQARVMKKRVKGPLERSVTYWNCSMRPVSRSYDGGSFWRTSILISTSEVRSPSLRIGDEEQFQGAGRALDNVRSLRWITHTELGQAIVRLQWKWLVTTVREAPF